MDKIRTGFMGAGGIARAHAYALNSIKFYYNEVPRIEFESVTSRTPKSREDFAAKYSFNHAQDIHAFRENENINTIFILGPNNVHFEHLLMALNMPGVKNIYLEKPVCASPDEENKMHEILKSNYPGKKIQVGFQYLQTSAVRAALEFWKTGVLGRPIHFDLKYYHGDYLQLSYREKRRTRLTPAPDGGAMADLGSHGVSLLMAFLGEELQIISAFQGGGFEDVHKGSDLFSSIILFDPSTKAAGTLSASRVSSGTGDLTQLDLYADKGTLRYSSHQPDSFEYFLESDNRWVRQAVGSNYQPVTSFPSGHVSAGWLRAIIHAHYIFLTGDDRGSFVPDLGHGLAVQRIVRETAFHLEKYRKMVDW
ncbi:MAG TPA: Gfo/Idh/MocA family oxidoreductase [Cyclobacteriaceae bacterium]|nr:Gfo/Idh/MocA family oxidoreductase [Cyclobacteriaceae bacterium]